MWVWVCLKVTGQQGPSNCVLMPCFTPSQLLRHTNTNTNTDTHTHTHTYNPARTPSASLTHQVKVTHELPLLALSPTTITTQNTNTNTICHTLFIHTHCSFIIHTTQTVLYCQSINPIRAVPPALVPEDAAFPRQLDFVVLSHNHYDHLDSGSVDRLVAACGPQLAWYVPLGLKAWFTARGVHNVTELDWWQEVQHPGSKVRGCERTGVC